MPKGKEWSVIKFGTESGKYYKVKVTALTVDDHKKLPQYLKKLDDSSTAEQADLYSKLHFMAGDKNISDEIVSKCTNKEPSKPASRSIYSATPLHEGTKGIDLFVQAYDKKYNFSLDDNGALTGSWPHTYAIAQRTGLHLGNPMEPEDESDDDRDHQIMVLKHKLENERRMHLETQEILEQKEDAILKLVDLGQQCGQAVPTTPQGKKLNDTFALYASSYLKLVDNNKNSSSEGEEETEETDLNKDTNEGNGVE